MVRGTATIRQRVRALALSDAIIAPVSVWRRRDFLALWAGQTVSVLGSQVSLIALPLLAVTVLGAGAFQTGLLETFQFLPFLLLGLPAGVWVDRLARRPVLIVADAGRALAMASIPLAWALGGLRLPQLYAVGFAVGVLTVFFDIAYQAYLPSLVSREELVTGNARLALSQSSAEVAGPGLGGLLVSAVTAPYAVAVDAASYAVSVVSLLLIRTQEPARRARPATSLRAELAEGVAYVLRHRLLRWIATCTALYNLFGHMAQAVVFVFAVRELGLGAGTIGLWFSLGSLGGPLGALVASRLSRWLGTGPTIALTAWLGAPAWLLVALSPRGHALPLLIGSGVLGSLFGVAYNITQVSLRQAITPHRLQGRMNATMRFLVWGTIPIGAFAGGVLGTLVGLRATLWIGAAGTLLAALPVSLSGVRRLRRVEDALPPAAPELRELEIIGRAV
jgi:MFS family permease